MMRLCQALARSLVPCWRDSVRQAIAYLSGPARNFTHEMIAHYRLGLESVRYKDDSGQWQDCWGIAIFIPVPDRPERYYKKICVAPWLTGSERPSQSEAVEPVRSTNHTLANAES